MKSLKNNNFLCCKNTLKIKKILCTYIFNFFIILFISLVGCINKPEMPISQSDSTESLSSPSSLSGVPISQTTIRLTWVKNSNNATGFEIERASDSNFGNDFVSTTVNSNTTSYTDSDLNSSTEYYYRVKAFNDLEESEYSNSINVTPQDVTQPTAKPTFECLSLYWSPADGASTNECKIQYRAVGSSTWKDALSLWYDEDNNEYRGSIVNLISGTMYELLFELQDTGTSTIITASTWSDSFPIAQTIRVPNQSTTLNITNSGTSSGYILYVPESSGNEINVNNAANYCVTVNAHHVILRGLTLKGATTHAVRLYNTHDIIIENCDISGWGTNRADGWGYDYQAGVYFDDWGNNGYACERIIIQNNDIHDPRSDTNNWKEYRVATSTYHPEGPQGITFHEPDGNIVIRYNYIRTTDSHSFNDGMGGSDNFGTNGFPGPDSDIYGNYINHSWDNPIEAEGGGKNVRIWGNFTNYSYAHIAIATVSRGPIYIWRNVHCYSKYYDTTWTDDQTNQGMMLKTDGEKGQGKTYYFHNTALQPPVGSTYPGGVSHGLFGNHISNTITRNNLFVMNRTSSTGSYIGDTDYPNPYPSGLTNDVSSYNYDLFNGSTYSAIRTSEVNGIFNATPIYSQTPSYDIDAQGYGIFTLASASPGFDDGVVIPNFNDNYSGSAPDMGAHEAGTSSMKFGVRN